MRPQATPTSYGQPKRATPVIAIPAVTTRRYQSDRLVKVDLGDGGYVWWEAATLGNALAIASFGKPIRNRTADRLIAGMLDRARDYNTDANKPLYVERLRIFGSYLDPRRDPLDGDQYHPGNNRQHHGQVLDHLFDRGRYVRRPAAFRWVAANDRQWATRTPSIGEAPVK